MALIKASQISGSIASASYASSASYALTASYALNTTAIGSNIFTKNITDNLSPNTVFTNQNIFNHDNLLVESGDTLLIEQGAEYFILGELTNSGSIIVSGSLIVNGAIYNAGIIVGPGVVLSNSKIVTYDKANQSYGFPQLDGYGQLQATGSLYGTASYASYANSTLSASYAATASYINTLTQDVIIIGNVINSGSVTVTAGITGSLFGTASIAVDVVNKSFLKNRTNAYKTDTIVEYESIFNPSNLIVQSSSIFIVEANADYYVLGDLTNNGLIIVDGTIKVGGVLYNSGSITGIGVIL